MAEIDRSRLRARTSSCTAGSLCRPAASRGKWRRFTRGGSLCVGPDSATRSGVTEPCATRWPFAVTVPAKVRPSARQSSPNARVMSIWASFLGKPWIQPRASAKSLSTQMYGQVVTSSPSSVAFTTMKNSLYCPRAGSSSSSPESEHDCQSTKSAAQRPGSACGSSPSGRKAATAAGSAQYSMTRKSPT